MLCSTNVSIRRVLLAQHAHTAQHGVVQPSAFGFMDEVWLGDLVDQIQGHLLSHSQLEGAGAIDDAGDRNSLS